MMERIIERQQRKLKIRNRSAIAKRLERKEIRTGFV